MEKNIINTADAPAAIGPYSQAVEACGFVFCSGQIPIDPKTGEMVEGSVVKQAEQVLENLKAIINAAGLDMQDVIKTTVYIANLDDFGAVNEVYARYFPANPPARACVEVSRLPKGALVEIDAIVCAS
ncbi:MAG: RidA family protein [Planctomycetes bacterium]|nr:RidA family protein [Planctomycetota bacterium]